MMYGFNPEPIRPGGRTVLLFIALALALLPSCQKSEGPGGTASIRGNITEQFYNEDYSLALYSKAAIDEEVFIVYGTDEVPGDRALTGPTGSFRFDYLYPGLYYVYFRSDDSTATLEEEGWQVHRVDLERGALMNLGRLEKKTRLEYDQGSGRISGVVKKTKYLNESKWPHLVVEYVDFAHEHEVYLAYGDHEFYDERVRTQDNGYFEFNELIPGHYKIFLYSEDVTRVTEHVVLTYEVTLEAMDDEHDLGEINIEEI